jgi:pyruvate-ferredoxin/flavodoxin oxidoreductase
LSSAAQTRRSLRDARQRWQQWQQLPDTDRATLERIGGHADPGPLATLLLTRADSASLAGGDAAEPGSGERLAVRLAMATAESRQRPALDRFLGEVDALREKISLLIRETLADALPADDLDALERGLDTVESRQAELGTLIASVEKSLGGGIDIPRLRRLVQLARDLGDLIWRLREGPLGIGRARLGLVFSADASGEWSGTFPDNPFATPVVVDASGDALAMSVGLLQGQLRQSTEAFGLVRRARHELEQAQATRASDTAPPRALRWDQLSMQEREVCPPLLVIGGDDLLRGDGLSQIDRLLKSDLPIRLIVLNGAGLDLPAQDAPDASLGGPNELDLALLALTRRHSYVAQTSIGAPDHLTHSLRGALDAAGPALVHLHAPSPSRHGFAPNQTVMRAQQAVQARVFPLFRYDPQGAGVFGSRFNLEGNPEPLSHWTHADDGFTPTPASWALGESRFAECFTPLSKHDADPLPVDEYLALDEAVRRLKTPVVSAHGEDGSTLRFRVAASMLQICEQRRTSWQVLQEIAGLVTPFTERVEQAARDQVAADREAELAALRREYESRIAALEGEMLEKTREAMRRRMMRLAGYSGGNSEGGNPN